MAGGRRPASYVSGARHNSGVQRSTSYDPTPAPPVSSTQGPSLPLWIPSIWQPPPLNSSVSPPSSDAHTQQVSQHDRSRSDTSSALAAALDSAVQSAVVRALGQATSPSSPYVRTASSASDQGVEDSEAAWVTRERELTSLVDSLQEQLDKRNDELRKLGDKVQAMERRMMMETLATKKKEERFAKDVNTRVKNLSNSIADSEQRLGSRIQAALEEIKANHGGMARLKTAQKGSDAEARSLRKRTQEIAADMRQLEINVCSEIEKSWCQIEEFGQSVKDALAKVNDIEPGHETIDSTEDLAKVERTLDGVVEDVSSMRPKLKRLEAQVVDIAKQTQDMSALNYGFQEGMRENVVKVTQAIEGLGSSVAQLRSQIMSCDNLHKEDVHTRLNGLESNIKALKKLIESNLRTQVSAEGIVKEQVSLITKHVCVAMRQYTTRRISENNSLIDQALRARVPDYAKNEGQFVLVREQDTDGNESVDIQRSSEVSSTASS
eukprot:GFKZ01008971.1.p1 GENE.GFKZ01008971.1~~GFKZ01008971.1.p1  ORF type:complete len:493 (-),score=85.76 GFKZ01008971.1:580-2058(-)